MAGVAEAVVAATEKDRYGLFDRSAVAAGAALVAFAAGSILWLIHIRFVCRGNGPSVEDMCLFLIPFDLVWWFTAGSAVFGFLFGPERTADLLSDLWSRRKDNPWP